MRFEIIQGRVGRVGRRGAVGGIDHRVISWVIWFARSLVLEVNGERLGFVSVDLGIYTSEHLVAVCKEKFGIRHLLISSSHTHSDPGNKYAAFYEEQIIKAVMTS